MEERYDTGGRPAVSTPLAEPFRIGARTAPNRLVFGSHATNYAFQNEVSETAIAYYRERARFGVGTIVAAPDLVDDRFLSRGVVLAGGEDAVAGYRRLADEIHAHDSLVLGSLLHPGTGAVGDLTPDWTVELGPSAARLGPGSRPPRPLEPEEIREIVELFGRAAANQAAGGLDGTEIDAGLGLLADFLSPARNLRDDDYGGSLDNRLRFLAEVLEEVRAAAGAEHALLVRLAVGDAAGEQTLAAIAAWDLADGFVLEQAGADALAAGAERLRAGGSEAALIGALDLSGHGEVEQALAAGGIDAIALIEPLIADPEWFFKSDTGAPGLRPRPCVGCGECGETVAAGAALSCPVNPAAGRERKWGVGSLEALAPAQARRVVVVGGGPAGMKAAELAARGGQRVTLVERGEELGGLLGTISGLPGCADYVEARDWLADLLVELGVEIHLRREVAADAVLGDGEGVELLAVSPAGEPDLRLRADCVVVATGGVPPSPEVAAESVPVLSALAALAGAEVGHRVVVLDSEAKHPGSAVAVRLAEDGHAVTVATPGIAVAAGVPGSARQQLLGGLYGGGCELLTGFAAAAIDGEGVLAENVFTGERRRLAADTVVLAEPPRAADELYWRLHELGATVLRAGDCVAPRGLAMAFFAGERAGREVARPQGPRLPPIVEDEAPAFP